MPNQPRRSLWLLLAAAAVLAFPLGARGPRRAVTLIGAVGLAELLLGRREALRAVVIVAMLGIA